jgi:hypothetical protein
VHFDRLFLLPGTLSPSPVNEPMLSAILKARTKSCLPWKLSQLPIVSMELLGSSQAIALLPCALSVHVNVFMQRLLCSVVSWATVPSPPLDSKGLAIRSHILTIPTPSPCLVADNAAHDCSLVSLRLTALETLAAGRNHTTLVSFPPVQKVLMMEGRSCTILGVSTPPSRGSKWRRGWAAF